MFLTIICLVVACILQHQQAFTSANVGGVPFDLITRELSIHDAKNNEIFRAKLAVDLGNEAAFPCQPESVQEGSECLEWKHQRRLYMKKMPVDSQNTTCYSVHWKTLAADVYPNDCFESDKIGAHWFGAGLSNNLTWPLDLGSIPYTPFITGETQKSQFGNVLARYLINSKGAAVIIDENIPLQIAVNNEGKHICIRAHYDTFFHADNQTKFPELKYHICTSHDMKSLHTSIRSHIKYPLWDGLRPADVQNLDNLISEPVWQIAPRFKHDLQVKTISEFIENVINIGFLRQGHILINEHWQNNIGDLTVDTNRLDYLSDTIQILHRRGFKVAFTFQPFISTNSTSYAECAQKGLLISEKNSDGKTPALTKFKSLASAAVLDITNNRTVSWIFDKLQSVIERYSIDSFYIDLGTAYDLPHDYQTEKHLINPDQFKTSFIKTFESALNIIGVSSAVSVPRPPIFVSVPPSEATWEGLRSVLPTILTYGVNGYPFVMPGAVGGDVYKPGSDQLLSYGGSVASANGIALPEKELYIRWLQLATFLPVLKFTYLPSKYNDTMLLAMARNLTRLRETNVVPNLLKSKREALDAALPLIRPLWMLAGGETALMDDQFAIGDEVVVAPILEQGKTSRDVFLPAGVWEDGNDGSLRIGDRWLREYEVPLYRVAYFIRRPDNMRL